MGFFGGQLFDFLMALGYFFESSNKPILEKKTKVRSLKKWLSLKKTEVKIDPHPSVLQSYCANLWVISFTANSTSARSLQAARNSCSWRPIRNHDCPTTSGLLGYQKKFRAQKKNQKRSKKLYTNIYIYVYTYIYILIYVIYPNISHPEIFITDDFWTIRSMHLNKSRHRHHLITGSPVGIANLHHDETTPPKKKTTRNHQETTQPNTKNG